MVDYPYMDFIPKSSPPQPHPDQSRTDVVTSLRFLPSSE